MDPSRSTATVSNAEALLRSFVQGERGGKLRSQLEALHPDASAEEIEDAIQTACDRFVDKAEGIAAPGQVYTWIRTTAHRVLSREGDHHIRELVVDPTHVSLQELAAEDPGPAEEAIAREDEAELATLVREVSDSLPERKRDILALYSAGHKRAEIATRLGLSERILKRDLIEIMDKARAAIARKEGRRLPARGTPRLALRLRACEHGRVRAGPAPHEELPALRGALGEAGGLARKGRRAAAGTRRRRGEPGPAWAPGAPHRGRARLG